MVISPISECKMKANPQSQVELMSFGYGFLGILIFSLTLPATRIAILGFDPVFVGLGRAIVAAGLSLILLVITHQTIPPARFLPNFAIVTAGVVIGFPLLSAIAMQDAPASHGAVILLGEHLSIETIGFAAAVISCVALGKRTQIGTK
jgi:hypothetical protein